MRMLLVYCTWSRCQCYLKKICGAVLMHKVQTVNMGLIRTLRNVVLNFSVHDHSYSNKNSRILNCGHTDAVSYVTHHFR